MTTTVTVKTHDWPVQVTTNDDHKHDAPERRSHGYTATTEFVPANSERQFYITNTRSIVFAELPADATELPGADANF